MLGENHSLTNEFPAFKAVIERLIENNAEFYRDAKVYHQLDAEIRELECDGAPIVDGAMHQLKHQRSVLKDSLYQRLLQASR
ncbi:YdcH family protein [Shewanella gelidii]|uniref:DUF465 domain-containing protein n=1 Tax=Shewanella gelidii TaxID=1642821 RepID=A0A917JL58_9GAMM|nr:YdcH family protein [Shewanella gelidii]MCL1097394.1 YdcH family protein [Shewanella gelidii]GGI74839.1 hypothetical protein GCM10009332_10350 [Shewanella gelidii]